jgi:PEP-utilising enzyme, mobile domain/Pyruvate phosphate dikinase, AMP/ATP-binding domain
VQALIELDERACRDPLLAGSKAARLASARAAGLPALPGLVIPIGVGRDALDRVLDPLRRHGRHAAQLQLMGDGVPALLAAELRRRCAALADRLVVRSSSPLEDGGVWSGAFTSFLGVRPDELTTAVAGCWAAALGRDPLERAAHLGLEPARLAMAVLIQPEIDPVASGTAQVEGDGTVTVVAVAGSPAPLLSGWSDGLTATVRAGEVATQPGGGAAGWLDAPMLVQVAALAEAVAGELGDDTIEWASAGRGPLLLQSTRRRNPAAPPPPAQADLPLPALRVARLLHRFGGPTGEALVLPWALAPPDPPPAPSPERGIDAATAWARAGGLAAELAAAAWGTTPGEALALAGSTLGALRRLEPAGACERIERLGAVDPGRARHLLALLATVAEGLRLPREELWSLDPAEVDALLAGRGSERAGRRPSGALAGRWEPLVQAAVLAHGRRFQGEPAAPGAGAGPAHLVGDPPDGPQPGGPGGPTPPRRAVCVARYPLPSVAPLLWSSSALVTAGGSAGAHLIHVARSLGVPAVVGCDLRGSLEPGRPWLVAVDGDAGVVAVTPL